MIPNEQLLCNIGKLVGYGYDLTVYDLSNHIRIHRDKRKATQSGLLLLLRAWIEAELASMLTIMRNSKHCLFMKAAAKSKDSRNIGYRNKGTTMLKNVWTTFNLS